MPQKPFSDSMNIPEEHKHILDQRLKDYASGKSKPISHKELMRRIRTVSKGK